MSELKPCPFCGGEAELCQSQDDGKYYSVFCKTDRCGANVGEDFYMEPDELIKQWNTRHIEEKAEALLDLANWSKSDKWISAEPPHEKCVGCTYLKAPSESHCMRGEGEEYCIKSGPPKGE